MPGTVALEHLTRAQRATRRDQIGTLFGFAVQLDQPRLCVSGKDVIVGVNGKKTTKPDEFLSEVESHRPGDRITIEVLRDGEMVSVSIVLK